MTHKSIARNSGKSGRVNISGSELEELEAEIGDDVDVADTKVVAVGVVLGAVDHHLIPY